MPIVESGKIWEEMLAREFSHHRQGIARINNGSFGSCPRSVLEAQQRWHRQWLEQPDEFYFGPLEKGLRASREAIASIIRAPDVEEIVLVDNVTTAAAMIAQDMAWGFLEKRFHPGDAILMLNCSYAAVKKCFEAYAVRAGARIIEVELALPILSARQIIDSFQRSLEQAAKSSTTIRLAVIDHITSMPSVVLPARDLVALCRDAGVEQIFVDGAHAIGNIELSMEEIDADYYSSNLHKWLFAPHSVAFLHAKAKHLERLHHPVVSHNFKLGLFSECSWVGTRDYSSQLAVTAAVEFIDGNLGGLSSLIAFNHRGAMAMAEMLAAAWGTQCGTCAELASSMAMVELPAKLEVASEEAALEMRTRLRREFGVEVPICFQAGGSPSANSKSMRSGTAYARVSHQIYNKLEDYTRLRDAVKSLAR
ncbi:hypothetical protein SELMODRAFT_232064 [Selaginella moellendorffii]|uniref:Aminotransferase class V domain-containing protein n=2 Tax=Selaginella moellendorffii TaxID=88036 RepID=D8RPZ5_SELML|nr:hypothetical protein SELMODRAFT_232064 [Selaginella moellendorffii]